MATGNNHPATDDGLREVLERAQQLNPLNTDHTANLARLQQAWASLETNPAQREAHYKKSLDYYAQATRLSPNTVHLYDQHAQALLDYSGFLTDQKNSAGAEQAHAQAQQIVARAAAIDP